MADNIEIEKHGKPWKVIGKFSDFKGADVLRKGILLEDNEDTEVKVKKLKDGFIVKLRRKLQSDEYSEETTDKVDRKRRSKKRRSRAQR